MGKTKKQNNNKKIEEPKSKKKFWIGTGIAGLILAAGIGIGDFLVNRPIEPKKESESIESIEGSLKEQWARKYNPQGYEITAEFLNKYPIHAEFFSQNEKSAYKKMQDAFWKLEKNPVLGSYTEEAFYMLCFLSTARMSSWLDPNKVTGILGVQKENPLYNQLKNYKPENDDMLIEKILNCATLITHKKLAISEQMCEDGLTDFFNNISKGTGDCSDYTFAVHSLYYAFCNSLGRPDLQSRVRSMYGATIVDDKVKEWHAWIQANFDGEWHDFEMTADMIDKDTPVDLSQSALYKYSDPSGRKWFLPFASIVIDNNKKRSLIHVLP